MADTATLSIVVELKNGQLVTRQLGELEAAGSRLEKGTAKLAGTTVASTRGLSTWGALQAEAAGHVGEHSLSIGRLERALASYSGHAAGANNITEILGASLLKFGIGSVETVGILAGIGAIVAIYEKLTEESRHVQEASDKAFESIGKMLHAKRLGTGAELQDQISAISAQIDAYNAKINANAVGQARADSGQGTRADQTQRDLELAANKTALNALVAQRDAANRILAGLRAADAHSEGETYTSNLAALIKYNHATAAERATALSQLHTYQDQLKTLQRINPTDVAGQSAIASRIRELNDALFPKVAKGEDPNVLLEKRSRLAAEWAKEQDESWKRTLASVREILNELNKVDAAKREAFEKEHGIDPDSLRASIKFNVETGTVDPLKAAARRDAEEVLKHAHTVSIASGAIANAITSLTARFGGSGILGTLGGGIGQAFATTFGGFGGTAVGQAIFQPILAAIGSAIGKVFDNLFGPSSAERAQARATRSAFADMSATLEILRAKSQGYNTTLLEALEANRQYYEGIKKQIDSALPGTKNEAERNARRAEVDRLAAQEADRVRADNAQQRIAAGESLEERALRAQGRNGEADRLALAARQEQELYDAQRRGMDAAYIARLKEVQAIEKTAAAMNALTTSLLNVPIGFRYQALIYQHSPVHQNYVPGLGGPASIPFPIGNPGGTVGGGTGMLAGDIVLQGGNIILDGEIVGKVLKRRYKAQASREFGDPSQWGRTS